MPADHEEDFARAILLTSLSTRSFGTILDGRERGGGCEDKWLRDSSIHILATSQKVEVE